MILFHSHSTEVMHCDNTPIYITNIEYLEAENSFSFGTIVVMSTKDMVLYVPINNTNFIFNINLTYIKFKSFIINIITSFSLNFKRFVH